MLRPSPRNALGVTIAFLARSRLLVTYLDRDMELVWTPKHLDKMSWHRSSSVQIKPLQPTNSFFDQKKEIVSESPLSERCLLWATS